MPIPSADILKAIPGIDSIDKELSGGQKHVYRCTTAADTYALKVIPLQQPPGQPPTDPQVLIARVEREVDTLAACNLPHLVKLGPISLASAVIAGVDCVYYSEEWIEGIDLGELLRNTGPLSVDMLVCLAEHITKAIDAIRLADKVHRDIKPGNIMRRTSTDDFVLLDLGLAFDRYDISLTAAGFAPGTFPYFSPEQCDSSQKRSLDFRSDLFALGVVLYEVATGQHPFYSPGMSSQVTMQRIMRFSPPMPSTLRTGLPKRLEEVIVKLIQKERYLRYTSCHKVLRALSAVR